MNCNCGEFQSVKQTLCQQIIEILLPNMNTNYDNPDRMGEWLQTVVPLIWQQKDEMVPVLYDVHLDRLADKMPESRTIGAQR